MIGINRKDIQAILKAGAKKNLKKLALNPCYYSVAFVLVHRVP